MEASVRKTLRTWLFSVSFFVALMVVIGGYTRLSRSGLSIVEWNVVTGVVPPLTQRAWEAEFAKYQLTPEYQHVNQNMTLGEYKFIYLVEYTHRLVGRITGLLFVLPLFYFLLRGVIPWRQSGMFLGIGLGFAFQGFLGWYMVQSGLVDRPSVSHFRLTAHLLSALGLLALCFWAALDFTFEHPEGERGRQMPGARALSMGMLAVVVLQIAYGGFMAGLKAGHISNTFPLMFGYLIPPGLLSAMQPWFQNLLSNATTVHFVHRWLAFGVLILAVWFTSWAKGRGYGRELHLGGQVLLGLVTLQILLGIGVIFWSVPLSLALIHQFVALCLFVVAIFILHRVVHA